MTVNILEFEKPIAEVAEKIAGCSSSSKATYT